MPAQRIQPDAPDHRSADPCEAQRTLILAPATRPETRVWALVHPPSQLSRPASHPQKTANILGSRWVLCRGRPAGARTRWVTERIAPAQAMARRGGRNRETKTQARKVPSKRTFAPSAEKPKRSKLGRKSFFLLKDRFNGLPLAELSGKPAAVTRIFPPPSRGNPFPPPSCQLPPPPALER